MTQVEPGAHRRRWFFTSCSALLAIAAAACGAGPDLATSSLWSAPSVGPQAEAVSKVRAPRAEEATATADVAADVLLAPPADRQADAAGDEEGEGQAQARTELSAATDEHIRACEALCYLTNKYCLKASQAYDSLDACTQSCLALPEVGVAGAAVGNSVQCRITYALLARRVSKMAFCRNAAGPGGDRCVE